MKASEFITEKTRLDPKCWNGYKIGKPKTKKGKKGVRVNNCIPEDGIITKQNTTSDVKPGETQRQAKKLGMTLDKKNRPPLLHKKAVKNSSPNTLFNLGLTEDKADELMAYAEKLGRDDMDYIIFVRAAKIARNGEKRTMNQFLRRIDTAPREVIADIIDR